MMCAQLAIPRGPDVRGMREGLTLGHRDFLAFVRGDQAITFVAYLAHFAVKAFAVALRMG